MSTPAPALSYASRWASPSSAGLLVSQALTLLVTPVIYLYMERLSGWLLGLACKREAEAAEGVAQPELFDVLAERRGSGVGGYGISGSVIDGRVSISQKIPNTAKNAGKPKANQMR
jgi:hypothetical protein